MKHPYLISAFLALLPLMAVGAYFTSNDPRNAEADSEPVRCAGASLSFPAAGIIGWTYLDPASSDVDAHGHRTIHTGIDVFADGGHGSPIYAPADGVVSRGWGPERVNLVLDVTNLLNDEAGLEVYFSHMTHSLVPGQQFNAGDVIGTQVGDHIHMSIGAFIGYDDREISQTQDPSPYFNASLSYTEAHLDRQDASYWCVEGPAAAAQLLGAPAPAAAVDQVHVVVSGDTLYGIAELYGVSVDDIAAANGLTDLDFLSLDQELIIPGVPAPASAGPATGPAPADTSPAATGSNQYTVVDGDTLYGIADKLGIDIETILGLNKLVDPDFLSIGDVLIVP